MRTVAFLSVLALLVLVPTSQAAINPDRPFETTTGYTESFDGIDALVSAETSLESPGAHNGSLFLGADTFTFGSLERLYWEDNNGDVQFHDGINLQVRVENGSSVAFRHPGQYDLAFRADHAVAFFADAEAMFGDDQDEELGFGPSLVAIPYQGQTVMPDLGTLPPTPITTQNNFNDFIENSALLLSFTDNSAFTLIDSNGGTIEVLEGPNRWVGFQGTPTVGPINARLVALPTPDGATMDFAPSAHATDALNTQHLEAALEVLREAEDGGDQLSDLDEITDGLAPVLNGAFLGVSSIEGASPTDLLGNITIVRFTTMNAERDGGQLQWNGAAALQIQDGDVAGADPLIGIFPWWSLLLWGVAIVSLVLRFVLKPDKSHPRWDQLGWVGWVGGILAGILVFILWDRETKALWGTSVLSGDASGTAYLVIAAVQLVPLLLAGICIGLPSRILIKSGTRFAGQGNLMRIGAIIAPFLVFLLGAPLMIDYLGALMDAFEGFS